jgi:high-affinity iron transporter
MFANYLIGLREGLEASLIVAILVAYLVKIDQRRTLPRLWLGVGLAVLLSMGVGAFLEITSQELTFQAQETFGGVMSVIAAGLITWMVFWMAKHAHELRGHLHGEIDRALAGSAWMLTFIAFMAVAREGIETALFLWAGIRSTGSSTSPLLGALLGLATAILIGILIYRGAVRLNLAKLFTWTGIALIVVAAGVLAYGVHDLQESGVLPGLNTLAFDVSAQIPPGSWYGTLLKGTINFSPATTWLELVAWVAYLVPTLFLYLRVIRQRGVIPVKEKNAPVPAA